MTYRSGMNSYRLFCVHSHIRMFPLNEYILERYVVSLANRLAYKSIKVYLAGVQFWSLLIGSNVRMSAFPRLYYVLRGIRRSQGTRFMRPRRIPITYQLLTTIHHRLTLQLYTPTQVLMLQAATSLAFLVSFSIWSRSVVLPRTFGRGKSIDLSR